jgi:hypothetical protein
VLPRLMRRRTSTLVLLAICLAFITLGSAPTAEASPAHAHATHRRKANKHRRAGKSPHASKPKKDAQKSNRGFEL